MLLKCEFRRYIPFSVPLLKQHCEYCGIHTILYSARNVRNCMIIIIFFLIYIKRNIITYAYVYVYKNTFMFGKKNCDVFSSEKNTLNTPLCSCHYCAKCVGTMFRCQIIVLNSTKILQRERTWNGLLGK